MTAIEEFRRRYTDPIRAAKKAYDAATAATRPELKLRLLAAIDAARDDGSVPWPVIQEVMGHSRPQITWNWAAKARAALVESGHLTNKK